MKLPITGGCACGAIRYQSTAEPVVMLQCHCRDCQRASGGASSELVVVPKEAFKVVKGTLRFHASPSEAKGMTRRGFCADCGSPVLGLPDAAPHIAVIRPGSFDDPSSFKSQMDVWTCDANAWDRMDPALPKFEKYPG
ncbi:MAG: Gfa-like protein [Verrucomicrobiales bacterium]|nr:Gfa-like protein [Verrucomicrobiales bacterium]